jgi:hypothetical protein
MFAEPRQKGVMANSWNGLVASVLGPNQNGLMMEEAA